MKQFVYIIISTLVLACAKAPSKELDMEASETIVTLEENAPIVSEEDALKFLITEKIQEHIEKKKLVENHPDFDVNSDTSDLLFSTITNTVKDIKFLEQIKTISDSVRLIKTEVVFNNQADTLLTDTIITKIKTSKIEIEGEQLKTTKITFKSVEE